MWHIQMHHFFVANSGYSKSEEAAQSPTENQPHFALYCMASCFEII